MDADTSKKKEQTNVADNTSPEGGGGEAVTAVKTSTTAQDDAATKNKTGTSASTTAVTTAKRTKKKRSTTSTTKFYAIRKNDCLKAPAIFVDWEDCSFYLDSQEGVEAGEYKEFDRLMDACEYIEEYLQLEQKKRSSSISSAAAKKRKSESSAAGSAAKKRKSTPGSSSSASRKKAPPASATAAAASALALLKGPKQSLGDDDDDDEDDDVDEEEEEATKKGPRKRTKKAQEKWDQMIQMLPKFGEKYDHYDVQQEKQDPQFSNLAESTGLLKKEIDCYLLDPETSRLTSKECKLLHSIGYIQAMRLTLPFHRKSSFLNRYFLENGTFKVDRDSTDQNIYNFAKDVADACRKIMAGESQPGTSTAAPAAAAAAAAAPTETQQQQADGEEAAANTRVTIAAGDGGGDSAMKQQKVVRIGAQKGWKGPLTQLQYEHLESIGFIQWLEQNPNEYMSRDKRGTWSRKRKGRTEEQQREWDELLDLLPKFHSKYGHYDLLKSIITKDDEFPDHLIKSGMELKTEVEKYEKNPSCSLLSPMEYRLLDAIGYIKSWKMSLRFDRKTKLWKDYFVEHGTFRVTSTTKNRMIYEFAKAVTDECKKIMTGESNTVTAEEARAAKANRKKAASSSSPDDEEEEEQQDEQGETGETNPAASHSKKNADKKWSDKNWFDGHLTQLQYQQLESIGLVRWLQLNPNEKTVMKQHDTKYHDRWEQNYEKLHAFYKANGRHPKKAEDSALHSWIHRQKRLVHQSITESEDSQKQQSHGIIFTSKQIGKLSMVGISFQVRKSKGMDERAQEWFDYVREHNGKHPLANIPIGKWAMDQRKKYQVWKETGNPGNLTQEFVDRLAAGGFPWVLKRGRGSTSRQQESYNLDEW